MTKMIRRKKNVHKVDGFQSFFASISYEHVWFQAIFIWMRCIMLLAFYIYIYIFFLEQIHFFISITL